MDDRTRFRAILAGAPVDRAPAYAFGTWAETAARWRQEGWREGQTLAEATGLDPDWEEGMWDNHGIARLKALGERPEEVLARGPDWVEVRTGLGAIERRGTGGSSISHIIQPALAPDRAAWTAFRRHLDPADPRRRDPGWLATAQRLDSRDRVLTLFAGSLYGFPRDWLGTEGVSLLAYDDPALLEEIVAHCVDHYMAMLGPVLQRVRCDLAYIFEDCCYNSGPLLSPAVFRRIFTRHYRRYIDFLHANGVGNVLLDSDGKVDALIPLWLDAGVDVVFPIEVGTWRADPLELRRRFGPGLRMMGGFDKHLIPRGPEAVRRELERLRPLVEAGGYIPLPDHRIPPDCSLEGFRAYVREFRSVFAGSGPG